MTVSWVGAACVVSLSEATNRSDAQVSVAFRFLHGFDDLTTVVGPFPLTAASPALVEPPWPDLSRKGDLLLAPATVTGSVRVLDGSGEVIDLVALPERLAFLDLATGPDTTYDTEERPALLAAILGEAPSLVGMSAVDDVSPEGLVELLDLAARVAAASDAGVTP